MKTGPLLVTLVLGLVAFSGCILPLPGGDEPGNDAPASITKKVVATFNTANEPDSFEDLVATRFEYRHDGADVPTGELTAEFLGEDGKPRSRSLTQYTTSAQVRKGDIITIPDANFTSGLRILRAGAVVAERSALDVDWFTAGGLPVPLSSTQAGTARYKVDSGTGFEFEAQGFGEDDFNVNNIKGKASGTISGTSQVTTIDSGSGPRLEMNTRLKPEVDVLVEATVREDGRTYDAGARVYDDNGEFETTFKMQFDTAHQLRKVGFSSRAFFDARVQVWDREHSRSSNYEPDDIEHPMVDESEPYTEEEVEAIEDLEAWVVEFLERLWSMRIDVGDDYRLHFESRDFGSDNDGRVTFDFILQVAGADSRRVGGQSVPTYRISQLANLLVDPQDGSSAEFDLMRSTYWISRESYLPVYLQSEHSQNFNKDKVEAFFRLLGEEAPDDLPDKAMLVLRDETTISLEEYSGDLTVAPILALVGANQGWMTGVVAASAVFFLVSDIGGETAVASPAISFAMDESSDRLMVTTASSNADWSRLAVTLGYSSGGGTLNLGNDQDADGLFLHNEPAAIGGSDNDLSYEGVNVAYGHTPVLAGDYLELCSELTGSETVQVYVRDEVANAIIGSFTFSNIEAC